MSQETDRFVSIVKGMIAVVIILILCLSSLFGYYIHKSFNTNTDASVVEQMIDGDNNSKVYMNG